MNLKKRNKELEEYLIIVKNYCNVLKKKNKIQKDSMQRMEKIIYLKEDEIYRLKKELRNYEQKYRNDN